MGKIEKAHLEAMKALEDAKGESKISKEVLEDIKEVHRQFLKEHSGNPVEDERVIKKETVSRKDFPPVQKTKKRFSIRKGLLLFLLLGMISNHVRQKKHENKREPRTHLRTNKTSNSAVASENKTIAPFKGETEKVIAKESNNFEYYYNSRFNFTISYPSFFDSVQESSDGSGCIFMRDEQTYLTVYGDENVWNETLAKRYDEAKSKYETIVYTRLKNNWFVISDYTEDGRIFYQKTALINDAFVTVTLYFPKNEKVFFSPIITKIFNNFPNEPVN